MKHILLAENEQPLAQSISQLLTQKGWQVTQVSTVEAAHHYLDTQKFDLMVVDRMLDDGDGLELFEYAKDQAIEMHLLCLSRLSTTEERIKGLREGADDYVAKPFSGTELVLRIEKLLSKQKLMIDHYFSAGQVTLYPESGLLITPTRTVTLRKRETEILACLFRYQNRVVTRETLINHIWGMSGDIPTYTTLDVYIRRLRITLGSASSLIKTVRGFGYMLKS